VTDREHRFYSVEKFYKSIETTVRRARVASLLPRASRDDATRRTRVIIASPSSKTHGAMELGTSRFNPEDEIEDLDLAEATVTSRGELQIQSWLRFAASKREEAKREVAAPFEDALEYKLSDSVFTRDDVRALIEDLSRETSELVATELERASRVAAAMLKLLFAQAEARGCGRAMTLDAHQLEDARVLEEMRAIERVALSRPASDFTRAALRVGMTPVEDDDDEFAFDVGKGKGKTVIVKETVVDVATARECEKLRADLAAARRDAGSRVQDSAQFQQLKRLMQQKTRELSMLRTRLRRYEPEADDGDVVGTEDDSFIEKKEEEDEEGAEVERERRGVDVAGEVAEAAAESPRGGGVAREVDVEASPGPPPPPPPDDDDDDDDDDEFDF